MSKPIIDVLSLNDPEVEAMRRLNKNIEPDGPVLKEINRVRLKPGDILVFKYSGNLSAAVAEFIKIQLEEVFKGHRCIVLEDGAELEVFEPTGEKTGAEH